jgi:hypothetical protein
MPQRGSEAAITKIRAPIRMILLERYGDVFYYTFRTQGIIQNYGILSELTPFHNRN